MKTCITSMLLVLFFTMVFGCTTLVPSHPAKSKSEFLADKKECEKQARSFSFDSQQDFSIIDEMSNVRECMKTKGWRYVREKK